MCELRFKFLVTGYSNNFISPCRKSILAKIASKNIYILGKIFRRTLQINESQTNAETWKNEF